MFNIQLTPEQEKMVKIKLCSLDYCVKCVAPLELPTDRYLFNIPSRTKRHLYCTCFIVCKTCSDDVKGTRRWFYNLDAQEMLYMAKDHSCCSIIIR